MGGFICIPTCHLGCWAGRVERSLGSRVALRLQDEIFGGLRQRLSFMRRWSRGRRRRTPPKFTFYICSHLWFSPCLARAEVKAVPQPGRSLSAQRLLFFLPMQRGTGVYSEQRKRWRDRALQGGRNGWCIYRDAASSMFLRRRWK